MADTLSPEERSDRMRRIRGFDTGPELMVRRYLHARGLRYRLHDGVLPGRPDLVLPKHGVVVFVHGCFWHAHRCQKGRIPDTRSQFWKEKLESNRRRDARNATSLRRLGWRVLTVWECSLSTTSRSARALDTLVRKILAGTPASP
ncbi:DNA mismatch endonuclease Vsr [Pseudoxanthomonas mexicana]|uniref:Very short patch repair endonuclease n=2 Tax=Pseudoxanthomonas mexicana TaxID=128785 RepID=A0A7G9TE85_PSEMX|nr:DNA mismatch endonuclease Vsr [Pseudoxanthomonas mexicana]